MSKMLRPIALLIAVFAMAAIPAMSVASGKGSEHGKAHAKGKSKSKGGKRCVNKVAFVVKGKLVSYTPDNPATTDADESSVTLTVTKANRHARKSGEVTVGENETYTAATDPNGFKVKLSGYETGESPSAGDKVRVKGKIKRTKKRCAPDASVEERYGDVNIKRIRIID